MDASSPTADRIDGRGANASESRASGRLRPGLHRAAVVLSLVAAAAWVPGLDCCLFSSRCGGAPAAAAPGGAPEAPSCCARSARTRATPSAAVASSGAPAPARERACECGAHSKSSVEEKRQHAAAAAACPERAGAGEEAVPVARVFIAIRHPLAFKRPVPPGRGPPAFA